MSFPSGANSQRSSSGIATGRTTGVIASMERVYRIIRSLLNVMVAGAGIHAD